MTRNYKPPFLSRLADVVRLLPPSLAVSNVPIAITTVYRSPAKIHRDVTMRCAQFLSMEVCLTWGTFKKSPFQGSCQFQQSVLIVFFLFFQCLPITQVRNDSSNSQSQPTISTLTSTSVSTSALNLISSLQLVLNLRIQIQLHLPLENFSCVVYENWVASRCTQLIHHNDSPLTTRHCEDNSKIDENAKSS